MSDQNYQSEAESLVQGFPDDLDTTEDEVADKLQRLCEEFSVPLDEAKRTVREKYQDDYDGDFGESGGNAPASDGDEEIALGDLEVEHDEEWMTVEGTVQRLFELSEAQSSWINSRGVLADDTGTTIFTVPQDAVDEDPALELEQDDTVRIEGVVGDAFNGDIGVKIPSTASVTRIDETYTPPENDTHITGNIVDIQSGSGLVKRCPEDGCTLTIDTSTNRCPEHGKVEDGEFDLRLKTIVDDGEKAQQVFFGTEATEAITGIDLEEAQQIARDATDMGAVIDEMRPRVLGRYFSIAGNDVGDYAIVNSFERVDEDWQVEGESVLEMISDARDGVVA